MASVMDIPSEIVLGIVALFGRMFGLIIMATKEIAVFQLDIIKTIIDFFFGVFS